MPVPAIVDTDPSELGTMGSPAPVGMQPRDSGRTTQSPRHIVNARPPRVRWRMAKGRF